MAASKYRTYEQDFLPGRFILCNEVAPEFSFGPSQYEQRQIVEGIKRGVKEALQESSSNGGGGIIEMTFNERQEIRHA